MPSLLRIFTREPLILFLLAATFFFFLDIYTTQKDKKEIKINNTLHQAIIARATAKKGIELNQQEKHDAVQAFINKRILIDEATRRGLAQDHTIELLLLRKIKAIETAHINEPTYGELLEYYTKNKEQYIESTHWTIEILEVDGSITTIDELTARLNKKLRQHAIEKTTNIKEETNNLQKTTLINSNRNEIKIRFGESLAKDIESADKDKWLGPYQHLTQSFFARITNIEPSKSMSFQQVERYVRDSWLATEQEKVMNDYLASLKRNYIIEFDI